MIYYTLIQLHVISLYKHYTYTPCSVMYYSTYYATYLILLPSPLPLTHPLRFSDSAKVRPSEPVGQEGKMSFCWRFWGFILRFSSWWFFTNPSWKTMRVRQNGEMFFPKFLGWTIPNKKRFELSPPSLQFSCFFLLKTTCKPYMSQGLNSVYRGWSSHRDKGNPYKPLMRCWPSPTTGNHGEFRP